MQPVKKWVVFSRTVLFFSLLQSPCSFADDTEIFLSRGKTDIKPNVLFILDDSFSMQWCLDKDWISPDAKTKAYKCPNVLLKIALAH